MPCRGARQGMTRTIHFWPDRFSAESTARIEAVAVFESTPTPHQTSSVVDAKHALSVEIRVDGAPRQVEGTGNGPISAFCDALASVGIGVRVLDYAEHALRPGSDAQAAAYVECEINGQVWWGVGVDSNTATASMRAVLSALNRSRRT